MNIFKNKYDVGDIDMTTIDKDSFGESLLLSVIKIKNESSRIDRQINTIATTPFISGMNAMEHYEALVDLSNIKSRLLKIQDVFIKWCRGLPEKYKKLYIKHFIKRDYNYCRAIGNTHYMNRYILPMSRSFITQLKKHADLSEKDLISCPLIYNLYNNAYNKKLYKERNYSK